MPYLHHADRGLPTWFSIRCRREKLAAELGISRSQLYATAIQEYLKAKKRSTITESLNRVYEKVDQTPDRLLETLQMAALKRSPW